MQIRPGGHTFVRWVQGVTGVRANVASRGVMELGSEAATGRDLHHGFGNGLNEAGVADEVVRSDVGDRL